MNIMMKNKLSKKLIVTISIIIVVIIAMGVFYFSHSTYWKYNDWWIVGNDIDSVEKKYGEFDINLEYRKAYYIGKDNSIIMPSNLEKYYWIEIDDNGIVTKVYKGGPIGG